MKILKSILVFGFLIALNTNAQNLIVNSEVGVFLGPSFMQTDYGEAESFKSASSNVGMNFGAAYILDLSDSRMSSSLLSNYVDYVKTRFELSYSKVGLEYDGLPTEEGSEAHLFEAMEGETKIFNIGILQEINFMSITKNQSKFKPYALLGIHYSSVSPDLSSTEPLPSIFNPLDENIFLDKQNTFSWTGGLGLRYALDEVDLLVEGRYHNFFSDRIDGIDTDRSGDKYNDNEMIFNIGVVFKLDTRTK